jgi:hypothetical protein
MLVGLMDNRFSLAQMRSRTAVTHHCLLVLEQALVDHFPRRIDDESFRTIQRLSQQG